MEMRCSGGILTGNAKSGRRCHGPDVGLCVPVPVQGAMLQSAVLKGQRDMLFRLGTSTMLLHGLSVDVAHL